MLEARHVRYVALLRFDAGAPAKLLASNRHWDMDHPGRVDFDARARDIVNSPGWEGFIGAGRRHLELSEDGDVYYVKVDEHRRVFLVTATRAYPPRVAYELQDRLAAVVAEDTSAHHVSLSCAELGLQLSLRAQLRRLCDTYDDLESIDRLHKVKAQTEAVTDTMRANIDLASTENTYLLNRLHDRALSLKQSADDFHTRTSSLRRFMCCRYWKTTALWVLLVLLVLAAVVLLVLKFGLHIL